MSQHLKSIPISSDLFIKKRSQKFLFTLILVCILQETASFYATAENNPFNKSLETVRLTPDPDRKLTPKTAFSGVNEKSFIPDSVFLSGVIKTWWLQLDLRNEEKEEFPLVITFDPWWDTIEMFDSEGNVIAKTGAFVPIQERSVKTSILAIAINDYQTQPIVFRFSAGFDDYNKPIGFIEKIEKESEFFSNKYNVDLLNSIYIGIVFGFVAFHFLIWLTLRDKLYLLYTLHVLTFSLIWIEISGLPFSLFYPDAVNIGYYTSFVLTGIAILCGNMFVEYFLRLKRNLPFASKFLLIVSLSVFVSFAAALMRYWDFATQLLAFTAMAAVIIYFYSGIACWKKGFSSAKYFLVAYLVFILAVFGYSLLFFGFFMEMKQILMNAPQVASLFSMFLLATAVSDHVRQIERRKRELEREMRMNVEKEVVLRTAEAERQRQIAEELRKEAERANQKLIAANKELERLNLQDPLTGIGNRRLFNKVLDRLWKSWKSNDNPFAVMVIDVDYFKKFNDTYGHLAGDECLREVAARISNVSFESFAARYGGEEFVVLLFGDATQKAPEVAERIRQRILRDPIDLIEHSQNQVFITVSIGVAYVDKTDNKPEDLMARADAALYEAKNNGRNCVVVKEAQEETQKQLKSSA